MNILANEYIRPKYSNIFKYQIIWRRFFWNYFGDFHILYYFLPIIIIFVYSAVRWVRLITISHKGLQKPPLLGEKLQYLGQSIITFGTEYTLTFFSGIQCFLYHLHSHFISMFDLSSMQHLLWLRYMCL